MRHRFHALPALLAAVTLCAALPSAAQTSAYASTSVRLRTGPGTSYEAITTVPRGARLAVTSCDTWCAVVYGGRSGYVSARYVREGSAPPTYEAPARRSSTGGTSGTYTNSRGNRVRRPVRADRAPSGASAQCRDGSYSFSQSRRGTCSHHGGVAVWL